LKFFGRTVIVQDGQVEKAMRKFKKKIQNSGLLQELRDRETYVKPTTRRKIKAGQARSRWRRYVQGQKLPPRQY
jgi:small subunit ribosomal protein S21